MYSEIALNRTVPSRATLRPLATKLRHHRESYSNQLGRLFRPLRPTSRCRPPHRVRTPTACSQSRFSPLDCLRTDELGLFGILADLLDPNASHGQGCTFLHHFLERIRHLLPGRVCGWIDCRPKQHNSEALGDVSG